MDSTGQKIVNDTDVGVSDIFLNSTDWPAMENHVEFDREGPGLFASRAILAIAIGLMGIGAMMTYSAGATLEGAILGWPLWEYPAGRQMVFIVAGLLTMLLTSRIPFRIWTAGRGMLVLGALIVSLFALALVYVPGIGLEVNNARRWVRLGPESLGLRFQPSELVKIILPIFLSVWIASRVDIRRFWTGLLPLTILLGTALAAIGLEDFGTAALLAAVSGALLLVGGARWWQLIMVSIPGVAAFGYLLVAQPYRIERLTTFMNIWADPRGEGYQAVQSLFTISAGGWWGRGLGAGYVKSYLPEARTDFIFAVICEELGIIGAIVIVGLLIALMWQGLKVYRLCDDPTGKLIALGITLTLGLQAAMNIAVVTVSVPTKGISLPLVSAGGSGAIFLGALVGVLANVARCSDRSAADEH
jgi:cell division protein FtsW